MKKMKKRNTKKRRRTRKTRTYQVPLQCVQFNFSEDEEKDTVNLPPQTVDGGNAVVEEEEKDAVATPPSNTTGSPKKGPSGSSTAGKIFAPQSSFSGVAD
jgi:hypothetical protein